MFMALTPGFFGAFEVFEFRLKFCELHWLASGQLLFHDFANPSGNKSKEMCVNAWERWLATPQMHGLISINIISAKSMMILLILIRFVIYCYNKVKLS